MLVLIVEDDQGLVELVSQLLEDLHYDTIHASNTDAAIHLIKENKPDIMILDYILKNQNSTELLKELHQKNMEIPPFVVTTGFGDEKIAVDMMKMGASEYLVKDINFMEMLPQVINKIKQEIINRQKWQQTEKELKKTQVLQATILDAMDESVVLFDQNLTVRYMNKMAFDACQRLNIPTDVIGKKIDDANPFIDDETIRRYKKVLQSGTTIKLTETKRYNKQILTIENRYVPIKTEGTVTGIITITKDITDKVAAKRELDKNADLFAKLYKSMPDVLIQTDQRGKINFVNENALKITQYKSDDILGKSIFDFFSEKDLERAKKNIKDRQYHDIGPQEYEFILNDGTSSPVEVNGDVLLDSNGQPYGMIYICRDISERVKKEQEIRQSRKSYQDIFNSVSEAIYIQDKEGTFIDVNTGAAEMYQMSREELIGLNPGNLSAEGYNDLTKIKKLLNRTYQTGEPSQFEFWAKKKNGDIILKDVIANKGKYFGKDVLITTARDITERKKMEEDLKKSEDKYRRLIENTGEGISIIDENETILFANPAAEEMFGVEKETLVGRNLKEFMDDENADFIKTETQRRKDGDGSDYHVTIIRPDKSERLIHVTATPYFDDNKKVIGTYGIMRDNTERWLAEEKLRESEQQFRTLVGNIPGITYRCKNDENWTMVYFSEEALKITGYENTDFINNKTIAYNNIIHPDDREHVRIRVQKGIESKQTYTVEYRIIHKDGSIHWVYEKGQGVYDENKLLYLDGVIIDIDDRKRIEKERQQLEVQLRQAQKMETIGTLAGGVAHDFNNILTPIMGYADMALTKLPKSNPVYEEIEYILSASQRARELVRQILTFSRQLDTEKRPVKLQKIVNEAVKLLRPTLPATISMDVTIDDDGYVLADPAQLHQVIMNLCTNSFHAMEETGGTLKINLSRANITPEISRNYPKLSQGQYLNLRIQDSGTGIDTKTMERIFEPFFTTKPVDKGTGMGLSVVHGIIQNHNGEIVVSSKIGQGATFQIFLPVEKNPPPEEEVQKKETIPGNESIVIVDDETSITKMTNKILTHLGYRVTSFNSSREILGYLLDNHQNYDLLLSDLTMPEMTGIDLAGELRRRNIKIPIVIMTGYGDRLSSTVRYNYGIETVISKPIIIHEIAEKLREIFDK